MAFGNNISLGMIIGGAVATSFSRAIGSATSKIGYFKKQAESARGFKSMIGDTIRLREELNKAAGTDAFAKIKEKHDKSIENLKKHGINVKDLQHEYAQLGKTVKGLELVDAGNAKIGDAMQNIKRSGQAVAGVVAATVVPALASANFESIVRDIAIKGGIARTVKEQALSEGILKDAQDSGMNHSELAQAVNTLVAGGMAVEEAASMAKTMAQFSIGQNAQSEDVAKMILALRQSGINEKVMKNAPEIMRKTLGSVAVAGDLGSFESKDMAKHFASLMPQMTMFGFSGERGAAELANMLQTQMKAAGSTDEAVNNLANLFSKITSEDTISKFEKKGFSLQNSMELAISQGLDPVTAFLKLVQKMSSQSDPAKAAKMADLQKQIADAQDPAAAQKMLDGYLEMAGLSEFISDRQAKQAALAVLQNQKLHESNLSMIQAADGEAKIEEDLAHRRAASARKWSEAGNAFNRVMIRVGDALSPVTDWFADQIIRIGGAIEALAKESPQAVQALTFAAAAFAAIGAVVGVVKLLWGGLKILQGLLTLVGGGKIPGGIGEKLNLPGAAAGSTGFKSVLSGIGGIGGSIAGAKIGAMTGLAAGPIGSAVLATIGGVLGGLGTDFLANKIFSGSGDKSILPEGKTASEPATAPATQNNTFSPTIQVTVQGDAKDPNQMANEIVRKLQHEFEQVQARKANGAMFDSAYAQ
ncbi:MAG: phage tail tape measure protein [Gammaproteobacteria bacterium]|nr:MAG: phage tail tape measure protein [Gammaproteobacteria bacterium]